MLSFQEKQKIAAAVEKILLELNHPEMPTDKVDFKLHVNGAASWSWADILPNWKFFKDKLIGIDQIPQKFMQGQRVQVKDCIKIGTVLNCVACRFDGIAIIPMYTIQWDDGEISGPIDETTMEIYGC